MSSLFLNNLFIIVVLPTPEGPEIMIIILYFELVLLVHPPVL